MPAHEGSKISDSVNPSQVARFELRTLHDGRPTPSWERWM